jgi:ketosteroid isomerase-like protein
MTLRRFVVTATLAAVVSGCGCARTARPSHQPPSDLRAAIDRFRSAVNAGDTITFFNMVTEDFEVFPPSVMPLRGAAARDLFRGLFTSASATLAPFTQEEIEASGDLAVQRYSFELTLQPKSGGVANTQHGSGLHIWRRGPDGQWRLAKDIWTTPATNSKT